MIKNIVLDFGKVLLEYDFKTTMGSLLKGLEDVEEFGELVTSPAFLDICDREAIPWNERMAEMKQKYPAWVKHWEIFDQNYTTIVRSEVPGMKELMHQLKAEGYKLYGLSNWCSRVHEVIAKYPQMFEPLDGYLVSSEVHLIKPEKAIYDKLCERYGLKAEECLFVDDKQPNVNGAIAAGMEAVLFTTSYELEKEIRVREARDMFLQGYNCAQAVACALSHGYTSKDEALRMAGGFGGGIGRMRLTCGAASGMFMMAGYERGQVKPNDNAQKMECYKLVQALAADFKEQQGSMTCAELLAARAGGTLPPDKYAPKPDERTAAYYQERPCLRMITSAVRIYMDRIHREKCGC